MWSFTGRNKLKCNTDRVCRGNPGLGALAYCIRNENGDVVYTMAKGLGETTSIEAEAMAIREAIIFSNFKNYRGIIIESDSLTVVKIINKQWKIPWGLVEVIKDIW